MSPNLFIATAILPADAHYYRPARGFRNGFTLIEICIVLVVIGLIIGGVLAGQDLVRASGINKQLKQFEMIKAGHAAFRTKYGCIPGDCLNASRYLTGATDGNGNGIVENTGSYCPVGGTAGCSAAVNWKFELEMANYFPQLSAAQMIAGSYTTSATPGVGFPITSLNSDVGAMSVSRDRLALADAPCGSYAQNALYSYDCMGYGEFQVTLFAILNYSGSPAYRDMMTSGIFTPSQVYEMDKKIDDGLPFTGTLRGANYITLFGVPTGYCATGVTRSATYNTSNNGKACHLAVKIE